MARIPTFSPGTWILKVGTTQGNTTTFFYSLDRPAGINTPQSCFLTWNDHLFRRLYFRTATFTDDSMFRRPWFRTIDVLGNHVVRRSGKALFTRMQSYHGKQFVFYIYLFILSYSLRLPSNLCSFRRIFTLTITPSCLFFTFVNQHTTVSTYYEKTNWTFSRLCFEEIIPYAEQDVNAGRQDTLCPKSLSSRPSACG